MLFALFCFFGDVNCGWYFSSKMDPLQIIAHRFINHNQQLSWSDTWCYRKNMDYHDLLAATWKYWTATLEVFTRVLYNKDHLHLATFKEIQPGPHSLVCAQLFWYLMSLQHGLPSSCECPTKKDHLHMANYKCQVQPDLQDSNWPW